MKDFVFGPVPSRRLGRSLGVDIVPSKICSLDCIYCEVCKTDCLSIERQEFFDTNLIVENVKNEYLKVKDSIDVVTVTASGEPTLNIAFGVIGKKLKAFVSHPLVLLTNGTLFGEKSVREDALVYDIVIPSIDAADEDTFIKINKPSPLIDFKQMIDGIIKFSKVFRGRIIIEVLLIKGINDGDEHLKNLSEIIKEIKYSLVQVGTAFRPTAYEGVRRLTDEELIERALFLKNLGIKVESVKKFVADKVVNLVDKIELFHKLMEMRPLSENDLKSLFGDDFYLNSVLKFVAESKLLCYNYLGEKFYKKP